MLVYFERPDIPKTVSSIETTVANRKVDYSPEEREESKLSLFTMTALFWAVGSMRILPAQECIPRHRRTKTNA
jgi:hypothetical protein